MCFLVHFLKEYLEFNYFCILTLKINYVQQYQTAFTKGTPRN